MGETGNMSDIFLGAVTVGERGQVVIPAGAREQCGISPGDKLLAFVPPDRHGVVFVNLNGVQRMMEMLTLLADSAKALEPPDEAAE